MNDSVEEGFLGGIESRPGHVASIPIPGGIKTLSC